MRLDVWQSCRPQFDARVRCQALTTERNRKESLSDMRMTLKNASLIFFSLLILLLPANTALGQDHIKRLKSPALVKGVIGGESHDSYVIHARKGRTLTVQINWRREHDRQMGDNRAEFSVSESPDFEGGGPIKFGSESDNGKRWSGRTTKTGDYYIYVTAHPTAHYTL